MYMRIGKPCGSYNYGKTTIWKQSVLLVDYGYGVGMSFTVCVGLLYVCSVKYIHVPWAP